MAPRLSLLMAALKATGSWCGHGFLILPVSLDLACPRCWDVAQQHWLDQDERPHATCLRDSMGAMLPAVSKYVMGLSPGLRACSAGEGGSGGLGSGEDKEEWLASAALTLRPRSCASCLPRGLDH